jgi:hypothetical protein
MCTCLCALACVHLLVCAVWHEFGGLTIAEFLVDASILTLNTSHGFHAGPAFTGFVGPGLTPTRARNYDCMHTQPNAYSYQFPTSTRMTRGWGLSIFHGNLPLLQLLLQLE